MIFSESKKLDTTCSRFAWNCLTVASRDKDWSIVVRLALPLHCSVDSVPFGSKKSSSLPFIIISIKLNRILVRAFGRQFEGLVVSFPGFHIGIIVDFNHFAWKYPCCHILLHRIRRV